MRVLSINQIAHVPIAKKTGLVSDEWRIMMQQLVDGLAGQLHPTNGVSLPQQTRENINQIDASKNQSRNIYNTTDHTPYIFCNGALKKYVLADALEEELQKLRKEIRRLGERFGN